MFQQEQNLALNSHGDGDQRRGAKFAETVSIAYGNAARSLADHLFQ